MDLATKRLILRPWCMKDAEECFRLACDLEVGPAAGWQPHRNLEETRRVLAEILCVPGTWAIVLKETGLPVGSITLSGKERGILREGEQEGGVGFWLGRPWWGRGIMREALTAVLDHAFGERGLLRVWAGLFDGNRRSLSVQKACGFRHMGAREVPVKQLGETRLVWERCVTREAWLRAQRERELPPEGLRVRLARREELPRVNELRRMVNDVHVQGRPDIFRPGFGEELQSFLYKRFEAPESDVLVAVKDGTVCGFATLVFIHRPETAYNLARKIYQVEEFGVDSAFRRQGAAAAMVDWMKDDARCSGYDRINLDAWEFNKGALAFYENAGFQVYRRYYELPL